MQTLSPFSSLTAEFILHQPLFSIGLLLLVGFILGKVFERTGLPAITGYILGGLAMSPSVTGFIPGDMTPGLHMLTDIGLGFIALTIGGEFSIPKMRRTGGKIFVITLFEALLACVFVTAVLSLFSVDFREALLLGAISAATAPAATVIIIRSLRARGDFADHVYGVVAFDDAVCVLLFSVLYAVVTTLTGSTRDSAPVLRGVLHAIIELGMSCLLGVTLGLILNLASRKMFRENEVLLISLAIVLLSTSCAIAFGLSPLIANMALGAALINLSTRNRRIFTTLEPLTPPLFALFFIIAGTQLDIGILRGGLTLALGLLYIASRFVGKYTGVFLGASLCGAPKSIRNNLGFCLFPQAGVAIGLALFLRSTGASPAQISGSELDVGMIVNIVLFSVFLNELVGPIISRFGILRGTGIRGRP